MKCPIDQTEMEAGYLSGGIPRWIKGDPGNPVLKIGEKMLAYKCPKCGKVELKVEE